MKSSLIQYPDGGGHLLYLGGAKGGATVGLYQNGGYDEPLFLWTLSKLIMEILIVKGFKGKDEILDLNRKDRNQYYLCIKSVQKNRKMKQEGICAFCGA